MINVTDDPWTIRRTRSNSLDINYGYYRTITCRRKSLGGNNWNIVAPVFCLKKEPHDQWQSYTSAHNRDSLPEVHEGELHYEHDHPPSIRSRQGAGVESGSKEAKSMIEDMRCGRIVDGLMPLHTYTSINHLTYTIGTSPAVVDLGETPQTEAAWDVNPLVFKNSQRREVRPILQMTVFLLQQSNPPQPALRSSAPL